MGLLDLHRFHAIARQVMGHNRGLVGVVLMLASSREDRFLDLDKSSPENTSLYNSDGVPMVQTVIAF